MAGVVGPGAPAFGRAGVGAGAGFVAGRHDASAAAPTRMSESLTARIDDKGRRFPAGKEGRVDDKGSYGYKGPAATRDGARFLSL